MDHFIYRNWYCRKCWYKKKKKKVKKKKKKNPILTGGESGGGKASNWGVGGAFCPPHAPPPGAATALSCYLSLIFKHSDYKMGYPKNIIDPILGGGGDPPL